MNARLLGLLALLLGGVVGCSSSDTPNSSAAAASDRPKVALIMKSLANEFFSTMADGAEQHHRADAGRYDLVVNGIKDERDLSRQVALVEEMTASGVDAIVIAPADSRALVPALRRAMKQGVVVVNIDNRLDREVLEQEGVSIPFVGPDNKAGAKKVGDHLAERLAEGDRVVVLEGIPTSFNGRQRREGFEQAMREAGAEIVDSQSADWEMSKANTVAASMLSEHPDVRAILASNDNMALGALAAVRSAGLADKVMIVGFDNIAAIQQAIRDGRVLATADQHGDQLAVYGIEAALAVLESPDARPEDRETPVDLVTAGTLAE